jgi:GalNAc-alpha-(1->4)-GalNAc-alpha-(1->3)-diNAcBac-PP-undecaprenol alpha-1,4-N-acetyl-D-galactosaminyltransferase
MPNKKNIAFMIHSLNSGGAERVLTTLANELVNKYNITIITLAACDSFYKLNPSIDLLNCGSQTQNTKSKLLLLKNHLNTLKKINEFIKLKKIELLIGFTTSVNVFTIIAANKNKIPSIISERNNPVADPPNMLWKILRNYYYKHTNYLVVQTLANKQFFYRNMPNDKIVIIKNPTKFEST